MVALERVERGADLGLTPRAVVTLGLPRGARRGGRVVDGGGLENRCTRKGTGGSNPSSSAKLSRCHSVVCGRRFDDCTFQIEFAAKFITTNCKIWPVFAVPHRRKLRFLSLYT